MDWRSSIQQDWLTQQSKCYLMTMRILTGLSSSSSWSCSEWNHFRLSFPFRRCCKRLRAKKEVCQPWDELMQTLDDATFCRMFRMTRATFSVLCTTIEEKVGKEVFKSELWLSCRKVPPPGSNVKGCAFSPVGGLISGKMKIAIMII